MIELVLADRCTTCDICVKVCPTNVFDAVPDAASVAATDWPGQYRRDSGWGRWRGRNTNQSWRMDAIFATAREILGR
jgi:Na+-translocating ferredoxin:NAD+ oxidoreductase RNF subunit RnfB